MDLVKQIRTQKILERQAFEAGKTCAVGERRSELDKLIRLGQSMGMEKHDAERVSREFFLGGCEVAGWNTWGL